jgi:hypothetical protein
MDNKKTRTDVLNHLAKKYNLNRYLEIGVQDPKQNFDRIMCSFKIGVDPGDTSNANYCMTSDAFFEMLFAEPIEDTSNMYDLIFIDGLHHADQVKKDFENSLKVLSPQGFIAIHDCNPEKEEHTIVPRPTERGHWNGDVYKFAINIHKYDGRFFTVNIDNGVLVFQPSGYESWTSDWSHDNPADWEFFQLKRKELLNLISWDEFFNLNP